MCSIQATTEQEDYARGFEVALNNLRQNEHMQQQQTTVEYTTTGPSIVVNPAITTSPPTASGILSMNGGSITYTNLGKRLQFNWTHNTKCILSPSSLNIPIFQRFVYIKSIFLTAIVRPSAATPSVNKTTQ